MGHQSHERVLVEWPRTTWWQRLLCRYGFRVTPITARCTRCGTRWDDPTECCPRCDL